MLLSEMNWPDVKEKIKENPVVIIPTGSTEQHGPGLPLHTDIDSSYSLAKKAGEITDSLVAPPLNYGYSELWQHYPGTMSLKARTFQDAVTDICESLIRVGLKNIFIINGHNPNLPLLKQVVYELTDKYEKEDIRLAAGTYIFMAKEECDKIGDNFRDGTHANEFETSFQLFLHPSLVKFDRIKDRDSKGREVISFRKENTVVNKWPDPDNFDGIYGAPSRATKEKGEKYFNAMIEDIVEFIEEFRKGNYDPISK